MTLLRTLKRLRRRNDGSVVVEFALAAPVFFLLLFGVFQIGITMWNYNALRGVAGEVSRWAAVQYQTNNDVVDTQIEAYAQAVAVQSPFMLKSGNLGVDVAVAGVQRVAGAQEMTLTITYRVPNFLPYMEFTEIGLTHTRSIFLITDT